MSKRYVTDGMVVNNLNNNSNYSVVIIDEFHEQRANTEIIINRLKQIGPKQIIFSTASNISQYMEESFKRVFPHLKILKIPFESVHSVKITYIYIPRDVEDCVLQLIHEYI